MPPKKTVRRSSGRTLETAEGNRIEGLDLTPRMLLGRSIALYGPSGSGKTVFVKYILSLLVDFSDQAIVICPTEPANQAYRGVIPPQMIHYSMTAPDPKNPRKRIDGPKGAIEFLTLVYQRQEARCAMAKRANNLETLRSLYNRLSGPTRRKCDDDVRQIEESRAAAYKSVRRQKPAERDEHRERIDDRLAEMEKLVLKKYISEEYQRLWGRQREMTEDERTALTYLHFKPDLILIFDDCAAEIKSLLNKEIFRKLFYQGRHCKITTIFCCQDETDLGPNLRKNVFTSVFTDADMFRASCARRGNGLNRAERARVMDICDEIFSAEYRKLVYIRDDPQKHHYYHFTPPLVRPRVFGSAAVQELCARVGTDGSGIDHDNPFYKDYEV